MLSFEDKQPFETLQIMNSILVLIDLTSISSISTDQAINLAKYKGAALTLLYISPTSDEANSTELKNKLNAYTSKLEESGVQFNVHIGTGDYKKEVSAYVISNKPDFVIVATHGKKGLKQNLFGSNIYGLIKSLASTTIVVNESTSTSIAGFTRILLPVAAHEDYLLKVERSCDVLASNGTIIILNINKPGAPVNNKISKNILATQDLLTKKDVKFEVETIESVKFSVGYSKETLEYVNQNNIDLISIMTKSSGDPGVVSADMDKENIILNEAGVSVLCAHS
jgi:nucleotide-binding universal stress UspA family protein